MPGAGLTFPYCHLFPTKEQSMRRAFFLVTLGLLAASPALAGDDGWNDCRTKPTPRCLADLAFTIGKTLPEQEASRYKMAEQQSKQNLRDGLGQLLSDDIHPLSIVEQIGHLAELGDLARARALLAQQDDSATKAQGLAVIAATQASRRHLKDARADLRRSAQLARKLKGQDADLYARYVALAQIELGSDDLALTTAGRIAEDRPRFLALLALSQRQWTLKRKDAARTSLSAAEAGPDSDQLAVARQWRLFGDEEGFRRALEAAERQTAGHKDTGQDHDLSSIAIDLSELGDLTKVHDRISRLPEPLWRAQSLISLANALPAAQSGNAGALLSEAADIAGRLAVAAQREDIESQLVHAFALQGDRQSATHHLSLLKEPKRRADALVDLASMTAPRDHAAAGPLFDQAKDEIQRLSDRQEQDNSLRDLIWAERRSGFDEAARQIPELIQDPLQHLLARAELSDWSAFDKESRSTKPSDHDLQAVATGHAMDGRFPDVLETVKRIGSPGLKAETLASSASLASLLAP